ncbi:MAG: hypothetical protein ABSB32_12985 [Thermodesulfobacteriota bacterium]
MRDKATVATKTRQGIRLRINTGKAEAGAQLIFGSRKQADLEKTP